MIEEQEKKFLAKVKFFLNRDIENTSYYIERKKKEINFSKKNFYDIKSEYKELEISDKFREINYDVDYVNSRINKIVTLKKILSSPYFARIDFNNEKIYIGLKTINDEENNQILVYDWRTPIASMFYNFELGDAYYQTVSGMVRGNISLKRQYKFDNSKLIRIIDVTNNIDDDYLQEMLYNSNEKMKDIVSTIQKEQNKVIRDNSNKYLLVQGYAGSGKTSVAMHRIAYLLYNDNNLDSKNILILSPNKIFENYISNVLPSLGEENVQNICFIELIKQIIKKQLCIENLPNFICRIINNADEAFMLSDDLIEKIDIYIQNYISSIIFKKNIKINNKVISSFEINFYFHKKYTNISLKERIDYLIEYICHKVNISYSKNKGKIKKILYNDVYIETDFIKHYEMLFNEKIHVKNTKYDQSIILLYLYINICNFFPYKQYKHIIIDEAQDYTFLQFKILKQIFPNASFTILGDVYQSILPKYQYKSLEKLKVIFNDAIYLKLNKTYRSSLEIMNYSCNILNINDIDCVRKKINKPIQFIKQINNKVLGFNNYIKRIAIITLDLNDAITISKNINCSFSLIQHDDDIIENNIVIIPVYLSKGLEFDRVIVYNSSRYIEKNQKYLYYIACTRAQHELLIHE